MTCDAKVIQVGTLSGILVWSLTHGVMALPIGSIYGTGLGAMVVVGDWLGRRFMKTQAYDTQVILKIVKCSLALLLAVGSLFIFPLGSLQLALHSILPLNFYSQVLWVAIVCLLGTTRYVVNEISITLEG